MQFLIILITLFPLCLLSFVSPGEGLDGRGYKNIEENKKWARWQLEELIGDTTEQFILLVSLYPTSC